MKVPEAPLSASAAAGPEPPLPAGRLVLLACGDDGRVASVVAAAAAALAPALALPRRALADPEAAAPSLQALDGEGAPALISLPRDPGAPLPEATCWAEMLGAWRLPALLLIPAEQLLSGTAAATTALLGQWRVPLVGLLQLGGPWQPQARRRDGLPWLGWLDPTAPSGAAAGAAEELVPLIRSRLRAAETGAAGLWS